MAESFAQVVFQVSLKQSFTYAVPPALHELARPGSRVWASFGRRQSVGIVTEIVEKSPKEGMRLKSLDAVLDSTPALTPELLKLGRWIAEYYYCSLGEALFAALPSGLSKVTRSLVTLDSQVDPEGLDSFLEKFKMRGVNAEALRKGKVAYTSRTKVLAEALREKGWGGVSLREEGTTEIAPTGPMTDFVEGPPLNVDQEKAYGTIQAALQKGGFSPFLLEGVTGSGKTEVYLRAIRQTLELGRQAIVLIPEIALTPQTVGRFRERLGDRVAVLHSRLSPGDRADEWRKLSEGRASVAVGARSALFAPVQNLGLLVVDEEHESSYKQEDAPRYQARDAALVRARMAGATAILGSATPSLESLHNAWTGKYVHLKLPRRAKGKPPQVKLVDLREEWRSRGGTKPVLALPLREALGRTLQAGEQAMLFLNRRGFHTVTLCAKCAEPIHCPSCAVPLTFHRDYGPTGKNAWACHYCLRVFERPPACTACGSKESVQEGLGTERLESETQVAFPKARLERMDMDTTRGVGTLEGILKRFGQGEIDVLVGTQMIAKGHDFPGVTLVGVVGADVGLSLPDFRSAERVFQLMVQVSGRAGRGDKPGTVYLQTFHPDHPCLTAALTGDITKFAQAELDLRKDLRLPPFSRLGLLTYRSTHEKKALEAAQGAAAILGKAPQVQVQGPYPAPFFKLRGQHRYHVLMRSAQANPLRTALAELDRRSAVPQGVFRVVDLDPQSML